MTEFFRTIEQYSHVFFVKLAGIMFALHSFIKPPNTTVLPL